jgi:hypothetical protein
MVTGMNWRLSATLNNLKKSRVVKFQDQQVSGSRVTASTGNRQYDTLKSQDSTQQQSFIQ